MTSMYLNVGIKLENCSEEEETFSQGLRQISTMGYIVYACVGSLLSVITLLLQTLVFAVVLRDARLRRPSNYFITSLASADVMISVFLMPMWTVTTTLGYWPLGKVMCAIWNIADYVICAISINTICFIATDRYMSLQFPFKYPSRRSGTMARRIYATIWVSSFVIHSLLIGITQYVYDEGFDPMQCEAHYVSSVTMTIIITSTIIWIPVMYTFIVYVLIYNIASRVAKNIKTVGQSAISLEIKTDIAISVTGTSYPRNDELSNNTLDGSSQEEKRTAKICIMKAKQRVCENKKALRTIGLLWMTFCICWAPVGVAMVYEAVHPGLMNKWFLISGYWFAYLNSLVNPFCYAIGNPQFRECLSRKILRRSKETASR